MAQPSSNDNNTAETTRVGRTTSNDSSDEETIRSSLDGNPPSIERLTKHKLATKRLQEAYKLIMQGKRPPAGMFPICAFLLAFPSRCIRLLFDLVQIS